MEALRPMRGGYNRRRRTYDGRGSVMDMRRMLRVGVVSLVLGLGAPLALGQATNELNKFDERGFPTNVPKLELQRPMKAWALTGLFLILCLAVTFKPSKRSHLD